MLRRLREILDRRAGLLQAVSAVLLLLAAVLFFRALPVERPLEWLTARVEALGFWGPVLFALLFVVFTVLFLPATPITVAAGAVFGPLWATVTMSLAAVASAAASFLLGRHLGHRHVSDRIGRYRRLHAVYHALGHSGWRLVAAVRLSHALPFGLQSFLFGLTPVRLAPYLLTTWLVTLPGTYLFADLGHLGAVALEASTSGESPAGRTLWLVRAAGLAGIAVAIFYVSRLVRRALKERDEVDVEEAEAELVAEPAGRPLVQGRARGALAGLLVAVVLLAAAAWSYAARDRIREGVDRWVPGVGRQP